MPIARRSLAAAVPVLAIAAYALTAPAQSTQVVVDAAVVRDLETRLQAFAASLPGAQREALDGLLRDAASAPADDPAGTTVRPVFFTPPGREGIVVQGGRTGIVVQGGRTAAPTRAGVVRPGGVQAIGPKPEDPSRNARQPGGAVVIGPKPEDPRAALGGLSTQLGELSGTLPEPQRAALDWLLQRAATGSATRVPQGAPGGLPPGQVPSLLQALGITPLAMGPKPEDSTRNARWLLRF